MPNFEKNVPFDPGYSKISFSFPEQINYLMRNYYQIKAPHQKKFQLMQLEKFILELINKSTAFYLGCILWGGFIHFRFKQSPKDIIGNNTNKLSEAEMKELDCAQEAKSILEFIQSINKDFNYFLRRPIKTSSEINEFLNSYIDFAKINNNFIGVNNTKDIKTPKTIAHFEKLKNEQLDKLCELIYSAIDSNKIENLLDIGFYKD